MLKKRLGTDYFLAFIHSLVNIQRVVNGKVISLIGKNL